MNNNLIISGTKSYASSLLLNFNGANNSTTFTDSSTYNNTVTRYGSAIISTAQSKFGGSSGYFDGVGDYLGITTNSIFALGTGDFTVELWAYPTAFPTSDLHSLIDNRSSASSGGLLLWIGADEKWVCYISANSNSTQTTISSTSAASLNTWTHLRATRSNGVIYFYVNGFLQGTMGTSGSPDNLSPSNTSPIYIATATDSPGNSRCFTGYIDDLRFIKGVDLYRTAYYHPVPSTALTASATLAPKFQNHIVMISTKSSGSITGFAGSSSGYYTVNWWDGTSTTYSSDQNFSKSAVGGSQYITIYPSLSNGTLSGYFYNVDLSNNSLTSVRVPYSRFITAAGTNLPGFSSWVYFYYSYYSRGYRWTWVPGQYVAGSPYHVDLSYNNLDATNLNQFYTDLLNGTASIDVSDNTGGNSDDPSIATAKGYTVYGSISGSTELLLNLDGTNGSTTFTDSSTNSRSITLHTGSPSLSTATKKYGTAALNFNSGAIGNDSYIIPDLSDMDWSIEFWIYRPTATAAYEGLVYLANSSGVDNNSGVNIHLYTSNDIHFNNNGTVAVVSTTNVTSGVWHHVACVSINNEKRVYFNGVLMGRAIQATAAGPYQIKIGRSYGYWANSTSTAYIDDFKLVRGKSIYTSDFVPPTSALTNSTTSATPGITVLLLKCNGTNGSTTFTDNGDKSLTPTVTGNAQISTAQYKYGTASAYFDGTGDYLVYSTGKDYFNLFNSNFTIECWIRPSSVTGARVIFSKRANTSTFGGFIFQLNGNKLNIVATKDESTWGISLDSTSTLSTNTWYHVAATRLNNTFKIFINGTEEGSQTVADFVVSSNSDNMVIGAGSAAGGQEFSGYIDDLRIIRGVSLYDSTFTVPSSELTIYP